VARFLIRRLGFVLLTLLLSSMLIFVATQVLPGDVATMVLGRFSTAEAKAELRAELGLDQPVAVQYGSWVTDFLHGDWGTSASTNAAVRELTLTRLRNSGMLALMGLLMYVPLGITLGLVAALRRNSWLDHTISVGSLAFIGLPEFVTGVILIAVFSLKLGWLPSQSAIDPGESFVSVLPQLILPGITIALGELAYVIRMTRSSTADVLRTDYVRTAVLNGLPRSKVLWIHVLPNALLPTITIIAIGIGWLIGGLIVTEAVFSYPGLGRLLLFGIQRRDVALIQASCMIIIVVFCVANLLADILYACLNPRIRYA